MNIKCTNDFFFFQCIKGEVGASGIPGSDGGQGHPVSHKHRYYPMYMLCILFVASAVSIVLHLYLNF